MSANRFAHLIQKGKCLRLICRDDPGTTQIGYVGTVREDSFEFGVVTNDYEHFSNISAPPDLQNRDVKFADVLKAKAY